MYMFELTRTSVWYYAYTDETRLQEYIDLVGAPKGFKYTLDEGSLFVELVDLEDLINFLDAINNPIVMTPTEIEIYDWWRE